MYEHMIHQMRTFIQDITNFNTITGSIINTIMDIHVFIIKLYTYIIITKLSIKHKHHRQLFITTKKATWSQKHNSHNRRTIACIMITNIFYTHQSLVHSYSIILSWIKVICKLSNHNSLFWQSSSHFLHFSKSISFSKQSYVKRII
jgi:hypothetical protein